MKPFDFPGLFVSADEGAIAKQKSYLLLVSSEYVLLFVAAIWTWLNFRSQLALSFYAAFFFAALLVAAWRTYAKPEQTWYSARALAESIKTLAWRYAMRASPYDDAEAADANRDFVENLNDLLRDNRQLANAMPATGGKTVTPSMTAVREQALADRKQTYLTHRIENQKQWYTDKSKANLKASRFWSVATVVAYLVAIVLVILQIANLEIASLPIEPIIVFASGVLGWMQIKRFNELSSAYSLTAHEIDLAETLITDASTEEEFTAAINDAELVFSREHTQWVARQAG